VVNSRVFVTGLGAVSAFGLGVNALWQGCTTGDSKVEPTPAHWSLYYQATSRVWSPLPPIDFSTLGFSRTEILTTGIPSLLAVAASTEGIRQANADTMLLGSTIAAQVRAGIFLGTGLGGAKAPFDNYRAHLLGGMKARFNMLLKEFPDDLEIKEQLAALTAHPRVNPMVICQTMPNAASAGVGIRFGIRGPNDTVCYACASGTVAIGRAFQAIQRGELDFAIAGGVEHLSDRAGGVFMGFDRLQTLAKPHQSAGSENRPFDLERSGFLFSEGGAAVLILESETSAKKRGVRPLAEVSGFALTSDAVSMVAMSEDNSAIPAMFQQVLNSAGIQAADIGYLNAHGTSTELNDRVESKLIEKHFGNKVKVNSTKSILGHTIGASGAFEAVVTVKSLQEQTTHVSRNLQNPIADLNFCTETAHHDFEYALSHSFGFGGHNAGLIFSRVS
jgi:3-oxoacyl-[acyl-carrier-protein] synthase II